MMKNSNKFTEIHIGLVRGRLNIPADSYIFEKEVADPADMKAIDEAVCEKLAEVFKPYATAGTASIPNAREYVDVPATVSTARLNLYVEGPVSAALAAVRFCYENGIPVTAWHYDKATGSFVRQDIL